jgi:hypothetical protein
MGNENVSQINAANPFFHHGSAYLTFTKCCGNGVGKGSSRGPSGVSSGLDKSRKWKKKAQRVP